MNYENFTTEQLIDALPENRPLYKDSGLWHVRTDDMHDVLVYQAANETFRDFVVKYLNWMEMYEPDNATEVRINLA